MATTPTTPTTTSPPSYVDPTRIKMIEDLYAGQLASQKASLEAALNRNTSDLEANRGKIKQQYQTQRNVNAVNYERSRRNFNQQAMMYGINTGAGAQANLALNNTYQTGAAQLGASEASDYANLDKSIADLKAKYEADVNDAIIKNDYNKAGALLDEYNDAYSRALTKAQQLAQYGDFSGYAAIYGQNAARQMELTWQVTNPLTAYSLGKISAAKYKQITGSDPPGITSASSNGGSYGRRRRTVTPSGTPFGRNPGDVATGVLENTAGDDDTITNADLYGNKPTGAAANGTGSPVKPKESKEPTKSLTPIQKATGKDKAKQVAGKVTGNSIKKVVDSEHKKKATKNNYINGLTALQRAGMGYW